jgi:hypothetical protein
MNLALDLKLCAKSHNVEHFLKMYRDENSWTLRKENFMMAMNELVRVRVQTEQFESDLSKMCRIQKRVSGRVALGLLRDLAPNCSDKELLDLVLQKSDFRVEKMISVGQFSELLCPLVSCKKRLIVGKCV